MKILISTWNIFSNEKLTINNNNMDKLLNSINLNVDIIVFGFQEVYDSRYIKKFLAGHPKLHDYKLYKSSTSNTSLFNYKFNVIIFLLIKKNIPHKSPVSNNLCINRSGIKARKHNLLCTKGMAGIEVNINNNNYVFISCHLPVFNKQYTKNAITSLETKLLPYIENKHNRIVILGDLNSRLSLSLLKNESKINELKSHNSQFRKFIIVDNSNSLQSSSLSSNKSTSKKKHRNLSDKKSKKQKLIKSHQYQQFQKQLLKQDLVEPIFKNTFLTKFKEAKITFLPTYKFNYITGDYLFLHKNSEKVPGYCDRILFTPNLKETKKSYQSHYLLGSDHIPVTIELND